MHDPAVLTSFQLLDRFWQLWNQYGCYQ